MFKYMSLRIFLLLSIMALTACGGGASEDGGSQFIPQIHVLQSNELLCVEYTPSTEQEQNDIQSIGGYSGSCSRSNALGQCDYFSNETNFNVKSIYYQDSAFLLTVDTLRQGCEYIQGSFSEIDQGGDSGSSVVPSNPELEVPPIDLDADDDGFTDFIELEYGTSISDWNSSPIGLLSNIVNFQDDNDSDGFSDYIEVWYYTDPNDPNFIPLDENGDFIPDDFDVSTDSKAPRLLAFDIASDVLVIENGLETVTFNMTIIDDISGLERVDLVLSNSVNQTVYVSAYGSEIEKNLVALSLESSEFGEYANAGNWEIDYVSLEDRAGNNFQYMASDLNLLGFSNKVILENENSDLVAPTFSSFSIANTEIEILTGNENIKIDATIVDDVSGVKRLDIVFDGPTGQTVSASIYNGLGGSEETVSFNTSDLGLYAAEGVWQVSYVTIEDVAGNHFSYSSSELSSLGFDFSVYVQNTNSDNLAPTLDDFSFNEAFINIQDGSETVTFNLTVSDNVSGLDYITVELVGPTSQTVYATIYGNDLGDLNHELSLESNAFGEFAAEGQWTIQYVSLTDVADNTMQYNANDLVSLGFDASINLYKM
ncbi:MAG: hypothetical protein ACI843_002954 [Psychrobacter glaciei]|jgi:hypothetical protein